MKIVVFEMKKLAAPIHPTYEIKKPTNSVTDFLKDCLPLPTGDVFSGE